MSEMVINDRTVFFSLGIGVVLGTLLILLRLIRARHKRKKLVLFILDFTFAALTVVVTYIGAIPLNMGRVRLTQMILELIGLFSSLYVFEAPLTLLVSLPRKIKENLIKITKLKSGGR